MWVYELQSGFGSGQNENEEMTTGKQNPCRSNPSLICFLEDEY